ncbi:acyl-CoA-binding domain-containing protein 5-like isoform X2 [Mercenaria mercenaria]|uniref:acyl-CoA-binding domain-containing protein 5-like isoform X2 n=1 Tax=Mercenaria mercenaria TaxID=6596 RepID=UPI00234EFB1A|nr:acyl-CoA-binding domain-containing protein 5-like isoform X2 [Mercenaria mercenaria]
MASASPKSKFDAAVKVIHSLPKDGPFQPSREMMLLFYGYYKQATEGPCTSPKPGFWDIVKKAKWEAWNKLGDMDRETAMINYVDELKKIVEAMPQTQVVGDFMEVLGSFYEIVDEDSPMKTRSVLNGVALDDGYNTEPSTDTSTEHGDISENNTEGDEPVQPEEVIQSNGNSIQSSDSEEEFCDTSADLEILGVNRQPNGPVSTAQNVVPVKSLKSNHVRFSDTNGNDSPHREINETIHVAQGFPFIASNNVNGEEDILCETSSPLNTAVSASKFSGDLSTDISVSNASNNNSNVVGVVDEGEDPPDGGDKGQQRNQKPSQSGRRSGASRTNLQGTGGRRALLPGGGAGGGGGAGEQGPVAGTSGDANEQITTILVRLQQDMANVLDRLNRLETQSRQRQREESSWITSIFNWGPFANRAGRAAFFFLVWPIVVHLALSYFSRRRRKR